MNNVENNVIIDLPPAAARVAARPRFLWSAPKRSAQLGPDRFRAVVPEHVRPGTDSVRVVCRTGRGNQQSCTVHGLPSGLRARPIKSKLGVLQGAHSTSKGADTCPDSPTCMPRSMKASDLFLRIFPRLCFVCNDYMMYAWALVAGCPAPSPKNYKALVRVRTSKPLICRLAGECALNSAPSYVACIASGSKLQKACVVVVVAGRRPRHVGVGQPLWHGQHLNFVVTQALQAHKLSDKHSADATLHRNSFC